MTSLPARPPISAPAREARGAVAVGVRGLWLVLPIAALLAVGAGGPEPSVLVLGPLVTYTLPVVVMVAFWWEDWPGTRLRASWSGWVDTALIAAGGVVLAGAGQAVVGGLDLRGLFDPSPGPGHIPTFPATLPLAGAAFVAMLQFTLVGEGWPLRALPRTPAGLLALAIGWAAGLAVYFGLVRSGAVPGAELGAAVTCVGAWQVLCFVVAAGWPAARIERRGPRLACAHAVVIGGGLASYALARLAFGPAAVTAAAGCVVAAGLMTGMLFEAGGAVLTLVLALAMLAALSFVAHGFDFARAEPEDWVAHVTLNALAVSTILHVAVGHRWPFGR